MAGKSSIEWTEATWNPLTGCTKISPGCKFCYAERLAKRLKAMGNANYRDGFKLAFHEHALEIPLRWKRPTTIFVNSMSDLFQKGVPLTFIQRAFAVMRQAHWHRFQILTKRADRLAAIAPALTWAPNIWMGVSVENADYVGRIDDLRAVPAATRFLSLEPLLGPLPNLDLRGIHWVIVGGESGPKARPMREEWAIDIRRQCDRAGVPFFFKQWGGRNKKKAGRVLEGQVWDGMPGEIAATAAE